jgi:PAS domain S-box-containing protein
MAANSKLPGRNKQAGTIPDETGFSPDQFEENDTIYHLLFENSMDAVLLTSPESVICWANPAACQLLGGSRRGIVGLEWIHFVDTGDPKLEAALRQFSATGNFREELSLRRQDGTIFPAIISANTFKIEGEPAGMLFMVRDRSKSRYDEGTLEAESARFRQFVDANIVGIAIADARGRIIQANDYYLNLLGVRRQDFLDGNVDWRKFTPPEWLPADEKAIAELLERGVCEPYEKEYVRADGMRVAVYIADAMLPGPNEQIAAFVVDITERKRVEQELRLSEERYSLLFEKLALPAVLVKLPEGVIVDVNAAAERLVGYSLQEMLGRTAVEIGIRTSQQLQNGRATLEIKGSLSNQETLILTKSGEQRTVLVNINLIEVDGQKCAISTMQDITERKRAEQALHASEERFRTAFENSPVGMCLISLQGRILQINRSFADILQYPIEELQGMHFKEFTFPEDAHIGRDDVLKMLSSNGTHTAFEKRYLTKAGKTVWAHVNSALLKDPTGQPLYFITQILDITERKQTEERLRYQGHLLENVDDAIIASNENYILQVWNNAAEKMYGWKSEEVLGKSGVEILQTRFGDSDPEEMRRQITAAGQYFGEATQLRKDGRRIPVEMTSTVLRDDLGKITGYVSLNRDITQRKQAEQKLIAQLEELQRWYKTSLEREERILELKREVNELLHRQNEPIRYPSAQEQI